MTTPLDKKKNNNTRPIGLKAGGTPYTVFIIDDSLTAREVLKRTLSSLQCKIIGEATNGELAVTMLKSLTRKPDFIFIDMEMPQMNGIETIKQIRPFLPESMILMVTSHAERDMVEELIKINVSGYIKKPFDRETILKKIAILTGRNIDE